MTTNTTEPTKTVADNSTATGSPTILLTTESTKPEILELADQEDTRFWGRLAIEADDMKERHKAEKKAHAERQKILKKMAELAKE